MRSLLPTLVALVVLAPTGALAQKVYLNPSNQTANLISGGGNEADYALKNANAAKTKLEAFGFTVRVDQDFTNAPANANSWGADIFVSVHSNAGGGHGTETLYKTTGGQNLADKIQKGLLSKLPYQSRGLKVRTDLHVLNNTNMYACLTEVVFHDCAATSGYTGHPPSESAYLKSAAGTDEISSGLAAGVCTYYSKNCTATPQNGSVKGVVYKNPTLDDHIAGATVTVTGGPSAVYDGTAVWSFDLAPGTYTINATAPGYKPGSKTATVTAGATAWASVGLDPLPAANGKIQGAVYASPDLNTKVAGAVVKLSSGAQATYDGVTDFVFDVPAGDYTLTATAAGYQDGTATAKVASGNTVTANVGLLQLAGPDASTPTPPDAAEAAGDDAATVEPADAGGDPAGLDSGAAAVDAGAVVPPASGGACGCATGGAGLALALVPALLLALPRRRRA